ncbi:MAG: polysaccharide biosynthesis C-terminal domain-containing protein [Lachnospiraceae bacterium]|nr:polysaccharide biosynthesis C-terminal domain-containing protein [Lachnospiraceae bacterium]
MTKREFYNKLMRLTVPIAFQTLMLAAVAAADAFMLGSLEQNAMSAVSLATQIQFIQNLLISANVATVEILGAQYFGKGDRDTLKDIFAIAIRWNVVVAIIFAGACVCVPGTLMQVFTNDEVLIQLGCEYLRIAGWTYLMTGISQCYLAMMKVTNHVNTSAIISSVTVVIDICLNAIFIFGLLGFPRLGVRGAALSTFIARSFEIVVTIIISHKEGYLSLDLGRIFKHNRLLVLDFRKCMWPILGACMFWGVGFSSYTAFMGHMGQDATAANSIAAVVRDLVCCMCDGIAMGGGILVGNELGAGRLDAGKEAGIRLMKISFLIGIVSTIIMLALTPVLLHFVDLSPGANYYLRGMMIIMAFYMIGRSVNTITINGIFSAGGDTLFDMYSLAVSMWCLAVPLAALGTFVFHWPVFLVYACTCLDEVGKIPWTMYHFRKYKWVKDLTR